MKGSLGVQEKAKSSSSDPVWARWVLSGGGLGNLETDLKKAKFVAGDWWNGESGGEQAPADEAGQYFESQGANGFGLTMEVETTAEFEIR